MSRESFTSRYNLDAIEAQYQNWRKDPQTVSESWRTFFEGFELGLDHAPKAADDSRQQIGVVRLIDAYRSVGHMFANLDPLSDPPADGLANDLCDFDTTDT